jgi:large subunit ribosomal protein L18
MAATVRKVALRRRRHERLRRRVRGTAARPRLAVFRSNKHTYAQLIDDTTGRTLLAASTLDGEAAAGVKGDAAKQVGAMIGARAKEAGIGSAVFDRGGFAFHGRVAQVAEGAREAGLKV